MKTLFKNATIIDGTGESVSQRLLVNEGKIIQIGDISANTQDQVIDATGKIICPGFIDTHTHSDLSVLLNPAVSAKFAKGSRLSCWGDGGCIGTWLLNNIFPRGVKILLASMVTLMRLTGTSKIQRDISTC